jgi:hypothetical protein
MQPGRSESAIMASAEQARFRIDRPNSRPRATCVVALDDRSFAVVRALKDRGWNGARFLRYVGTRKASQHLPSLTIDATLRDADGGEVSLMKEVSGADAVIMVTATDAASQAAEVIGNACAPRGLALTALVLKPACGEGPLGRILVALRPHTGMLVVSSGEDYVGEMLMALRA